MPPSIPPADTERIAVGEVFQVAKIVRGAKLKAPPNARPEMEDMAAPAVAPRIADYQLQGRFPSSDATVVFLAHKMTPYGIIRRAVVKWAARSQPGFEQSRTMLLDESRAIAFLDHPNIVKILDVGEDSAGVYLAIEYVPGPDLRKMLKEHALRNERLPVELASYITVELLRGLEHAHSAVGPDNKPLSIIHRDVNPSNVIISNDGYVKLTDFGMVHMRGRYQDPTAPNTVKGKIRYLAPEYIADQSLTASADIYGAGITLFELLTGKPVFAAEEPTKVMTKIMKEGPPYGDLDRALVPAELTAIVRRSTEMDPEQRFATARGMSLALEEFLEKVGAYVSPTVLANYLVEKNMPVR
jgi:serine/threonine-protein kinase